MKKSKLSLCLTSGFVVAMSLAACSAVSEKGDAVVTIKGSDGKAVDVLTDTIYDKYKSESNGVAKFYNAILESLIRYEYANPNEAIKKWSETAKAIKSNQEIKEEAENNVKNDKNTADQNAKTNGTSYETEWESILKSHDCKDEAELLQYYIYQLEKDDITEKFFLLEKGDALTKEWLGVDEKGKKVSDDVKGVYPYHIRHVLASISGGSTNFYDATITQDEAKNLGTIMEALLSSSFSFAEVAKTKSGDTGSAAKGGDLGIMSTTTSFVNEFKLGIYAYDSIYTHKGESKNTDVLEGVGLNSNFTLKIKDKDTAGTPIVDTTAYDAFSKYINGGKLQEVPYDAFLKIKELAEQEKDSNGRLVNKGNEHYYPRNVLFNYYLNFHNPFVITNEQLDGESGLPSTTSFSANTKFVANAELGTKKYLTDAATGNIIIGVRSEHGIHFMVMEKSIYDYADTNVSLQEYYTTYVPSDKEYPRDAKGNLKNTYVNFITTDDSTYTTRANEVKEAIKSFDSTYDYRLFEYILKIEKGNVEIHDEKLLEQINQYISRTRVNNLNSANKSLDEAWRTYAELVALQYDSRTDWSSNPSGLAVSEDFTSIHPRCAIGFKSKGNSGTSEWAHGGACHYDE